MSEQTLYEQNFNARSLNIAKRVRLTINEELPGTESHAISDETAAKLLCCQMGAKEAMNYAAEMFEAGYYKGKEDTQDIMKGDYKVKGIDRAMKELGLIPGWEDGNK